MPAVLTQVSRRNSDLSITGDSVTSINYLSSPLRCRGIPGMRNWGFIVIGTLALISMLANPRAFASLAEPSGTPMPSGTVSQLPVRNRNSPGVAIVTDSTTSCTAGAVLSGGEKTPALLAVTDPIGYYSVLRPLRFPSGSSVQLTLTSIARPLVYSHYSIPDRPARRPAARSPAARSTRTRRQITSWLTSRPRAPH